MEIIFHAHNAVISDNMRLRAERAVRRLADRVKRPVDAIVRFAQDGRTRRVELVMHAPGKRSIVAAGTATNFGPALSAAATRVEAQLGRLKRTPKSRARLNGARGNGTRAAAARANAERDEDERTELSA